MSSVRLDSCTVTRTSNDNLEELLPEDQIARKTCIYAEKKIEGFGEAGGGWQCSNCFQAVRLCEKFRSSRGYTTKILTSGGREIELIRWRTRRE